VAKALFASSTVVEVLADGALVANALDRIHATTIASDIGMSDFGLFDSHVRSRQVFGLQELLEDILRLLLELIVDKVFEGLPGDALLFLGLLLARGSGLLAFILHLLVDGDGDGDESGGTVL
jgi:hypothetical protein